MQKSLSSLLVVLACTCTVAWIACPPTVDRNARFGSFAGQRSGRLLFSVDGEVEGKKDEAEWRTVLSTFKLYKSAFGDLKVSSRRGEALRAPPSHAAMSLTRPTDICLFCFNGFCLHMYIYLTCRFRFRRFRPASSFPTCNHGRRTPGV